MGRKITIHTPGRDDDIIDVNVREVAGDSDEAEVKPDDVVVEKPDEPVEKEPEMIELKEHRAMVELPEDCIEALIECKVWDGEKVLKVKRKLTMADIREAFRKADDGYIDENDTFVLTDEGREYTETLRREFGDPGK